MVGSELAPADLKRRCDLSQLDFETTAELEPAVTALGAKRALEAIDFGLQVNQKGYNIFALNFCGTEEREYLTSLIKEEAETEEIPDDLCYVHNFQAPNEPQALRLPAGLGIEFKEDLDELLTNLKQELEQIFSSKEYSQQKNQLQNRYKSQSNLLWSQLEAEVEELGFILEQEEEGFAIIPLSEDGNPMSEEGYRQLSIEEREDIQEFTQVIQEKIDEVLEKVKGIKEEYKTEIENLKQDLASEIVSKYLDPLVDRYTEFNEIINYFGDLESDILDNIDIFSEDKSGAGFLLLDEGEDPEDKFTRYKVNLVVDNSQLDGAPVVVETNPTYYNLVGRIEYDSHGNQIKTDLLNIKSGALQQANGGYLILDAKQLLSNFKAWEVLKRVLETSELKVENLGQEYDKFPLVTLEPESISLDVKVILLGSTEIYRLLYQYDSDFKELFKIKADFDQEMEWNQQNNYQLVQFIAQQCQDKNLHPLEHKAVEEVIEYIARVKGNQTKLSTKFNVITDLLYEADAVAKLNNQDIITKKEIKKALDKRDQRLGRYEDKLQQLYQENKILIDTTGKKIGQINGLSVLDLGDYRFGRPSKITAAVYRGQQGVIDIEREVNLSGKIHSKGVFILAAYLGEKFAQDNPLSLSASLCFEQMYSSIDGDSASSAELYALLSALAEVPIRQDLAVTGSVNQQGEIQPVGGVTEKVEGFFKICQEDGLTDDQGVLIPEQNISDLMLDNEIVEAVAEDKFHIYTASNIKEGIELLTGMEADTINSLVQDKVNRWANDEQD
ncbi:ATP-binding protein [Halanaerocella petrolearia]